MLTENEIRKKLQEQAERFAHHYARKEYAAAKMAYFRAQTVAVFLEFPEAELAELFGNRPYKEDHEALQDGLFPEHKVEKASWECVRIHQTYDDLHLRPRDSDRYADVYVKSWRDLGGGIVQVQLETGEEGKT